LGSAVVELGGYVPDEPMSAVEMRLSLAWPSTCLPNPSNYYPLLRYLYSIC
jgi:hypothetical protein